jgi:hypothetical protein
MNDLDQQFCITESQPGRWELHEWCPLTIATDGWLLRGTYSNYSEARDQLTYLVKLRDFRPTRHFYDSKGNPINA